jgi:predicted transcriptional regulator
MATKSELHLSRRERQIMDAIYARGEASVTEVRQALAEAPSYSAVRTLMNILETKGHLKHRSEGIKYIYLPTRSRKEVSKVAVRRLLTTFFDGSMADAVAALLDASHAKMTTAELDRLAQMIEQARKDRK